MNRSQIMVKMVLGANTRFEASKNKNKDIPVVFSTSSEDKEEHSNLIDRIKNETASTFVSGCDFDLVRLLEHFTHSNLSDFSEDEDDSVKDPDFIASSIDSNISDEELLDMALQIENNLLNYANENMMEESEEASNENARKDNKKTRKIKRNTGKMYFTKRGKQVKKRQFRELENCRRKCNEKINANDQKCIFERYWALGNYNLRQAFASNLIEVREKKSERKQHTGAIPRKRTHSNFYFLEIRAERIQICQKCFCSTLDETEQFIKTVVKRKLASPNNSFQTDQRGHQAPPNKLSEDRIFEVRAHISDFPAYESHYGRSHSEQKYLQPGLTLATMYRLYCEKYEKPISITTYSEIFKTMNLKLKSPKLDTCNKCEVFEMKINIASAEEKSQLQTKQAQHHADADFAYKSKSTDKILSQNDRTIKVYAFDLEQCLPTPYFRTSVSFYKRSLWTFNLTVHDCATNQPYCYMWHEGEAHRGGNEIASCLYRHLKLLNSNCTQLIFYSDSCSGQNKNSYISTMFTIFLHSQDDVELIDHKFLVPGHTHMECDVDHSVIERKKKKTFAKIHHPRDWYQFIRTVGVKQNCIVEEMTQAHFFDFALAAKEKLMWRKTNTDGEKFIWQQVRWLRYTKEFGVIYYKTSLEENAPFKQLKISYTQPIPISKEKQKDLLSMLDLIDPIWHEFYKNLSSSKIPNTHPDTITESESDGDN